MGMLKEGGVWFGVGSDRETELMSERSTTTSPDIYGAVIEIRRKGQRPKEETVWTDSRKGRRANERARGTYSPAMSSKSSSFDGEGETMLIAELDGSGRRGRRGR